MTTSVSALVLSYNQEGLIAQAIMSLVEQTCQLDQIVISDDGSTDQTWNVIQETIEKIRNNHLYNGDIVLNRNNSNLGFIDNFNLGVSLCDSDLIMYNAGDDISMPLRNEMFLNEYTIRGNPKYFLGHSQVLIGDSNIRTPPIEMGNYSFERLSISCALHIGASQYFSKSLVDDFGEIKFKNTYEDLILGYRALLTGSYYYIAQPLVKYDTSGLSGWTKNDYWRKRLRFKETLEQRIIDSVKFGRNDIIDHIVDCYQQYGYGVAKHPSSVSFVWLNFGSDSGILSAYQSVNFDFIRPFINIEEINDFRRIDNISNINLYIHYEDFVGLQESFICGLQPSSKLVVDLGCGRTSVDLISKLIKLNTQVKYIFISCDHNILNSLKPYGSIALVENLYDVDGPLCWRKKNGVIVAGSSLIDKYEFSSILENNLDFEIGHKCDCIYDKYIDLNFTKLEYLNLLVYIGTDIIGSCQEEHILNLSKSMGFNVVILDVSTKKIAINGNPPINFSYEKKYLIYDFIESNKDLFIDHIEGERNNLYFEKSIQKRVVDYKNAFELIFFDEIYMNKLYPL